MDSSANQFANTVSKKELKVTSAGTHSVTWTIPVQNLKTTDVTFTPELTDTTGLFSSNDLSNCEGTFTTGSSLQILLHLTLLVISS